MANARRGEGSIEIDGTIYNLKLDNNAFCVAETATGSTTLELFRQMDRGSFSAIRALFYCSLLSRNPTVTIEGAGDLIDAAGNNVVIDKLSELIRISFPQAETGGEANPT